MLSSLPLWSKKVKNLVNRRPLTEDAADLDDGPALMPADFMLGGLTIEGTLDRQLRRALESIHDSMYNGYVQALKDAKAKDSRFQEIREGDLVLVLEKAGFKVGYKLGVLSQCFPGPDGIVRNVRITTTQSSRTAKGPGKKDPPRESSGGVSYLLRRTSAAAVDRYVTRM